MENIVNGIKSYFKDRKNRIVHALTGVSMLILTVFDSINPYVRVGVFAGAVGFNLLRMRYLG
ncbi:hypothetical protein [uncultured Methanobacterium sp.]|jgi:hypothetical protein|uniref:hypothetical protein n=1 Tax=uncultured Methanobacterium sp. TaxID=176306 RepID=UPI002AA9041C|nr:hypothetical protein [uncultured Methanobacterium sp.]